MPLYDYACLRCGAFSASRPMKEYDQPAPCPGCGTLAPRAISVPALLGRAARQDGVSSEAGYPRMRHAASCGCCPR